jgi:2'-hydroxyisoflavone reductase
VRVLVLGGTVFLGRHVVEAALARGDEVTLFNRGRSNPDLFPDVEKLRGDRNGELAALAGRRWEAVIDPSGYVPRVVRASAERLADAVEHYTFVSSQSVYADTSQPGIDETAPVHTLADETAEEIADAETYGALKVLCERAAERAMPGRVLYVRAGVIVGPHDPSNRLTYWVTRIARGGEVLAPMPRTQPVQLIDARDLAEWMLAMAETKKPGTYNATGPDRQLTMEEFLNDIRDSTGSDARFIWVGERFLVDAGVEAWNELPLWLAPGVDPAHRGFLSVDISRAIAAGLRFRPISETVRDTLARAERKHASGAKDYGVQADPAGLEPEKESDILRRWRQR